MKTSYAVTWRNGDRKPITGRLELGPDSLCLEGRAGSSVVREEVPYSELGAVSVTHGRNDRIDGRRTLLLERRGRGLLRIASAAQPWIVSELAERLAAVHLARSGALCRLAIVVPIRRGAREKARELLCEGAPFDPEGAGLNRHSVLLGDGEAVFLFESTRPEPIERLFRDPELWTAAETWKDVVAGPACVAEVVYDWQRGAVQAPAALGS